MTGAALTLGAIVGQTLSRCKINSPSWRGYKKPHTGNYGHIHSFGSKYKGPV